MRCSTKERRRTPSIQVFSLRRNKSNTKVITMTTPTCTMCGKAVNTNKRGFFHARPRRHIFDWYMYELKTKRAKNIVFADNFKIVFKNNITKVLCYTKLQREIVYSLWWLFRGWQRWDYWECHECMKK